MFDTCCYCNGAQITPHLNPTPPYRCLQLRAVRTIVRILIGARGQCQDGSLLLGARGFVLFLTATAAREDEFRHQMVSFVGPGIVAQPVVPHAIHSRLRVGALEAVQLGRAIDDAIHHSRLRLVLSLKTAIAIAMGSTQATTPRGEGTPRPGAHALARGATDVAWDTILPALRLPLRLCIGCRHDSCQECYSW